MVTPDIIIASTNELFSCVSMSASPGQPYMRTEPPTSENLAGIIHFSGKTQGYAVIHMPLDTAIIFTREFLFLEEDEIDEESLRDTICEITNILAGRVKAHLDPQGSNIQLSLPSFNPVFEEFAANAGSSPVTLPFYMDDGEFTVEVLLH